MSYAALKELQGGTASHCPGGGGAPSVFPIPRLPSKEPHGADEPTELVNTTSEKVKANYASRYACCRASPLVCPNQALLEELSVLERHRELQGLSFNALSYARAISVRCRLIIHSVWIEPSFIGAQRCGMTNYAAGYLLRSSAYPHPITRENYRKEVPNLPHLGGKIQSKVISHKSQEDHTRVTDFRFSDQRIYQKWVH